MQTIWKMWRGCGWMWRMWQGCDCGCDFSTSQIHIHDFLLWNCGPSCLSAKDVNTSRVQAQPQLFFTYETANCVARAKRVTEETFWKSETSVMGNATRTGSSQRRSLSPEFFLYNLKVLTKLWTHSLSSFSSVRFELLQVRTFKKLSFWGQQSLYIRNRQSSCRSSGVKHDFFMLLLVAFFQ